MKQRLWIVFIGVALGLTARLVRDVVVALRDRQPAGETESNEADGPDRRQV